MIANSIVLPAFFPSSMDNEKSFLEAIKLLNEYGIDVVEFYYKSNDKDRIKKYLDKYGFRSIFLAAMKAKQENLNLSSLDENTRKRSLLEIQKCVDGAYFYNSESILVNSGKRPMSKSVLDKDNNLDNAYKYLKESLILLLEYINKKSRDYKLNLTLEPGDTDVDSFSLIGDTDIAIRLIQELREKHKNVSLTMDTSHIIQLGENPIVSIEKALPYCNHIHLANCIIKDKSHALYGDKHPEFGAEDSELSLKDAKLIFNHVKKIYENSIPIIGLEIIFRNNQTKGMNEYTYFNNIMKKVFKESRRQEWIEVRRK